MTLAPTRDAAPPAAPPAASPASRPAEPAPARPPRAALGHIPGTSGWPVVGSTFGLLADPQGFAERHASRFGPIYRASAFGESSVTLLGPQANEFVLLDPERLFSSRHGWHLLGAVFPGGLLLRDADEHRLHRRALSVAFKAEPLRSYLAQLNEGIAARVAGWRAGAGQVGAGQVGAGQVGAGHLGVGRAVPFTVYPAMKRLTLDLAATAFLGAGAGADAAMLSRAYVDMIAAVLGVVRAPLPGTAMRRGLAGRAAVAAFLGRQVARRREEGGADLFSQLCGMRDDDGAFWDERTITDHMSFLIMAAHDTLTSSLTALTYLLAANPAWQERLRGEVAALGLAPGEPLGFDALDAMPLAEMAFKEAMRLYPPVPSIPRRAMRGFTFAGVAIPAGTGININPLHTHRMPELWPDPERFDPGRFTPEAQRGRHRFAHVPFGGGAHMCLGLHFATLQAKCFLRHLLGSLAVGVAPGYAPRWRMWPIPAPRDGLRVELRAI